MVSVCLPSDALLQHLPSYLGFSYLGRGVSLHRCSRKAQPLLLTLDEGYLLTATLPDLQRGIARLLSCVQLFATPWTVVAHQAPLSMGREEQPHVQGAAAARAQKGCEELLHVQGQDLAGGGSTTARGKLRLCPASACQTGLPWSSPPA